MEGVEREIEREGVQILPISLLREAKHNEKNKTKTMARKTKMYEKEQKKN